MGLLTAFLLGSVANGVEKYKTHKRKQLLLQQSEDSFHAREAYIAAVRAEANAEMRENRVPEYDEGEPAPPGYEELVEQQIELEQRLEEERRAKERGEYVWTEQQGLRQGCLRDGAVGERRRWEEKKWRKRISVMRRIGIDGMRL